MLEPRTVKLEYPARWEKPRIDLDELAKLSQAGWRVKKLGIHFGVSASTVKSAYWRLRKSQGLEPSVMPRPSSR